MLEKESFLSLCNFFWLFLSTRLVRSTSCREFIQPERGRGRKGSQERRRKGTCLRTLVV